MEPTRYVSFLVRLWRETSPDLPEVVTNWQGEAEHIQTGQRREFDSLDELLDFLRRQVASMENGRPTDD